MPKTWADRRVCGAHVYLWGGLVMSLITLAAWGMS